MRKLIILDNWARAHTGIYGTPGNYKIYTCNYQIYPGVKFHYHANIQIDVKKTTVITYAPVINIIFHAGLHRNIFLAC